jgi:valyl-tRNA synthetase
MLGDDFAHSREKAKPVTLVDHWILARLASAQKTIDTSMAHYRVGEAFDTAYHTVWDDVADWYIEASKTTPNKQLLAYILRYILVMVHPFAPFVTETIWQTLPWVGDGVLMAEQRPVTLKHTVKSAKAFADIQAIITEARYITTVLQAPRSSLYYSNSKLIAENSELIKKLAKLARVGEVESGRGLHLTETSQDCWLDIDLHTAKLYITKLRVAKEEKQIVIERLEQRLANKGYMQKAPKAVVEQTKNQLKAERELLAKLDTEITTFHTLSQA